MSTGRKLSRGAIHISDEGRSTQPGSARKSGWVKDTQEAWVEFAQSPGEETFNRFYETSGGFATTICCRILGREQAEEVGDAVQEVYRSLIRMAHTDADAHLADGNELVRITARRYASRRRMQQLREQQRFEEADQMELVADPSELQDKCVARRQLQELVRELIDDLPEEQRLVVKLHFLDGLTHDELAATLMMSRSRAGRLLYSAKQGLERRLRERGVHDSAVAAALLWATAPSAEASAAVIPAVPSALVAPPVAGASKLALSWKPLVAVLGVAAAVVLSLNAPDRQIDAETLVGPREQVAAHVPESGPVQNPLPRKEPAHHISGAASPAAAPAFAGYAATGRVVHGSSGQPIALADLVVLDGDGKQAARVQSGPDGTFQLPGLPSGNYRATVTASTAGLLPTDFAFGILSAPRALGDIELDPALKVSGRLVRLKPNEEPVGMAGEEVVLYAAGAEGEGRQTAFTTADGTFQFTRIRPGNYGISPAAVALRQNRTVTVSAAADTERVELAAGEGVVSGTVISHGRPAASAYVRLYQPAGADGDYVERHVLTNQHGKFLFENLPPGDWKLDALETPDTPAYLATSASIKSPAGEPLQAYREIHLPDAEVQGVVSLQGGATVAGAQVRVIPADVPSSIETEQVPVLDYQATTRADGTFSFSKMPSGRYRVIASLAGFSGATAEVSAAETSRQPLRLELSPVPGADLAVSLSSAGAAEDFKPWVDLVDRKHQDRRLRWPAQRGADGSLQLFGVPAGSYTLEMGAFSHETRRRNVEISAGDQLRIDEQLAIAGAVEWQVTDSLGLPANGVDCLLQRLPSDPSEAVARELFRIGKTTDNGTWLVRGLPAGRYRLSAEAGGAIAESIVQVTGRNLTTRLTKAVVPGTD